MARVTLDDRQLRLGAMMDMVGSIPQVQAADARRLQKAKAFHRQRVYRNHHQELCYSCGKPSAGFFRCTGCRDRVNKNRYKNTVN